jgi:hypothetical protein
MKNDGVLHSAYWDITRNCDTYEGMCRNSNRSAVFVLKCEPKGTTEVLALES